MPRKPPPDFEALMADLKSPDWKVRAEAARVLGQKKHRPSVDFLLELLQKDRTETVKSRAAVALGNIRDPRAIEPLLQAGCVKHAANQIPKFGEAAVPALKARLHDKSLPYGTRSIMVHFLGIIGGEAARSAIISAAWDEEVVVRHFVAEALGRCEASEESFEALLFLMRDPVPMVGSAAIQSLGRIRDARSIEFLVQVFHGDSPFEKDFDLFCSATHVLRVWANVRGKTFDELAPHLRDEAPIARLAAALSLMWLGDKRALEPLWKAAQDADPLVHHAADWAYAALEKRLSYNQPLSDLVLSAILR